MRATEVEGKRERTVAGLRKAIRIMLRLNRWKHRSLKRLAPFGGDEETEASRELAMRTSEVRL